jgi:predicted phage terminase large subunit-like protein
VKEPATRRKLGFERIKFFFPFYFSEYIKYKAPSFHGEILDLLQNEDVSPLTIAAFRGSAKSTLASLVYPLWAIMGKPQKKYIIIVSRTQEQARQILRNIRVELERNELLRKDLGPFHEEEDEWRNATLVISNFGARITAISVGQSMRELRHLSHRPQIFIFDDLEDLEGVQTRESRDKTWNWLMGDAIPAGDGANTRVVMVGNHLHDDATLQRYRKSIESTNVGVYRAYPLVDVEGKPLWPDKYPDEAAIEALKRTLPDDIAYLREYQLTIVSPEDQVIRPEWIQCYDPADLPLYPYASQIFTSVDPAITENTHSDYTAMVSAYVVGEGKDRRVLILPDIVNKRMQFPEMIETIEQRSERLGNGNKTKIFVEVVGFQHSLEQCLRNEGYPVEGVKIGNMDKRMRLSLTAAAIRNGEVLFPPNGVELLIQQLTGFGNERYDDLADAFSSLIIKLCDRRRNSTLGIAYRDAATGRMAMVNSKMKEFLNDVEFERQKMQQYLDYKQAIATGIGL